MEKKPEFRFAFWSSAVLTNDRNPFTVVIIICNIKIALVFALKTMIQIDVFCGCNLTVVLEEHT